MKTTLPCGLALGLAALAQISFSNPPTSFKSVGPGGGGAFFAPALSPHRSDEIFVSSDMSDQFHTLDVTTHMFTLEAHRERARGEEFLDLVAKWMTQEATRLGLRGPLPGHPSRGDRWSWYAWAGTDQG